MPLDPDYLPEGITKDDKLSALMRKGFEDYPHQTTGLYIREETDEAGEPYLEVCALGAVLGSKFDLEEWVDFRGQADINHWFDNWDVVNRNDHWKQIDQAIRDQIMGVLTNGLACPADFEPSLRLVITTLNDSLGWSIPQIADLLESLGL